MKRYHSLISEGIRFAMFERKELPKILGQNSSFPDDINRIFELAVNAGEPQQVDQTGNSGVRYCLEI